MLTCIKRSINIRALFVLLALALLMPAVSWAQAPTGAEDTSLDNGDTMAYINVSNAKQIGQDEENIVISFSLENTGPRPQFDIRYGIELVRREGAPGEETQVIVDTFVVREEAVVSAGESVAKVVEYPLAGIPPGTYEIWVIAQTSGGAMLGIAKAADYTASEADMVEIMAESCVLNVAGETGTSYNLYQGVDVSASENIVLTCTLMNHGASSATVLPSFMTYERKVYGDQVPVSVPTQTSVTLAAGEERQLSLTIPKASAPQAYDVVLSLVDETTGAVVSNNLVAHYVIQGASATIQTVDFDKNAYRAGEEIKLKLNWTPAADTFEDSRSGGGTNIGTISATTRVVDGNGAVCSEEKTTQLADPATVISTKSMIDCVRPAASVQLVAADGTVLDRQEIAVKVVEDLGVAPTGGKKSGLLFAIIAASALALVAVLVAMNRRKKIDFINTSKMFFIFAVAATSFFGIQVEQAEAVSWIHYWSNSKGDHATSVDVNPTKFSFTPGETIQINSRIANAWCANARTPVHTLTATLQSQVATISERTSNYISTYYSTGYMTAPTAPGVYTVTMRMQVLSYVSSRTFQIEVVAPPPPVITTFTGPVSVPSGTSPTLSWAVSGATACSINQGVGVVSPTSGGNVSAPAIVSPTTYTLTCTNSGGSVSKVLSVGVTGMTVTPNIPYGNVAVNDVIDSTTVGSSYITVTNIGGSAFTVTGITPSAHATCFSACPPFSLAPGASRVVVIRFTAPGTLGPVGEQITVNSDIGSKNVTVSANIVNRIVATPNPLDFGNVVLSKWKEKTVSIKNNSVSAFTGSFATILTSLPGVDTPAPNFSCTSPSPCDINIPAYGSQVITLRFTPNATGTITGVAAMSSGDTIGLRGVGVPAFFDVIEQ